METNTIIILAILAVVVVSIVVMGFAVKKEKDKLFTVFAWIVTLGLVGLFVMGIAVKHWWIYVPSGLFAIVFAILAFVSGIEDAATLYEDDPDQ